MNQLGYFGKTRHRGDFVRFNLPQTFTKVWDDWLQQIILEGEQYHQDGWKAVYDNAPAIHFVLSAGIAGNQMWIGIVHASQDKVGRRFPFCLAMSLPEYKLPCVEASLMAPWFADASNLLRRVASSDFDFDQLQQELGVLAEQYAQESIPDSPALSTLPNLHSDDVGIAIDTADPLNNPAATQALLDGLLTQTLGEYSLWMCQNGSHQSLLHSGLPTGQSALSLFSGDTQTCTPTCINLAALGLSAASVAASTEVTQLNELAAAAQPSADSDSLNLDSTIEHLPLDTSTMEQVPSADDWAALDDFSVSDDTAVSITIPEVEPLELDEDESADSDTAPWET